MASAVPSSALALSSSQAALAKVSAPDAAVSSGQLSAALRGHAIDLHRFRTVLPDRWSDLLKAHFNGDVALICVFFGVSEKAARNWLAGHTGPSGSATLIAVAKIPGALPALWRDAA